MLKKLSFLISMPFTGILLVVLITSMAVATFIESGLGTNTAWAMIYGTWWFEGIFILVLVNLVGSVIINKLYKRAKITVLVFHLAFVLIIIGAGITRYVSFEGTMHIREGESSSFMIGSDSYVGVKVSDGDEVVQVSKKTRLSPATASKFRWKGTVNGKSVVIRSVDYLANAMAQYVAMPGGEPYVQLMLLSDRRYNVNLENGKEASYAGISFSLNSQDTTADFRLVSEGDELLAYASRPVTLNSMNGEELNTFAPGTPIAVSKGSLLSMGDATMALQYFFSSAVLKYVAAESGSTGSGMDVVKMEVKLNGMKSDLFVPGMAGLIGQYASLRMGTTEFSCSYGSERLDLPFSLKLEDFRIDRYPGSNSPSSFESDVVLLDDEHNINQLFNIYMNNVLKHRGYRFYQSSYDQDEKGTILSVNKDLAGTAVTYAGYLVMALGMLLALFARGTRFTSIVRSSSGKGSKAAAMALVMLLGSLAVNAQEYPVPSKEDAMEFGKIWVQGKEGRFKPVNTLSNEVLMKVVKKSTLEGSNADQVLLGMIVYPEEWQNAPIFEVENPEILRLTGFKGEYVSFNDFIAGGRYILSDFVNEAYKKRVQDRNDLDKEVMKLDEKVNVFYMVQTGMLLKLFPDPGSEDGTWYSVSDVMHSGDQHLDSLGQVFELYKTAVRSGDQGLAGEILNFIGNYQEKNSDHELHLGKKKAEILYNKSRLFIRILRFYAIFGLVLIILQFMRIFRPGRVVEKLFWIGTYHVLGGFIVHTVFLGLRWYISGHAPLSNGYESMIFVSWVTLLAGLLFVKKTGFTLALTTILAAISLLVAHMSWMNPDITNLVPVLKSPWLTIHVSVIMSGYGFLGLSWLMGLINLVFFSLISKKNADKVTNVVQQVTRVNQLSVIIGLYLLTIGTFLGGVWANESWGRYWGWDPKETWALISVLVYSFIAHMHKFPGLKGSYAFNLGTLLGYFSILMTYFGVNYFLGGIHSYAGGLAFSIPVWVFVVLLLLILLVIFSYNKKKKLDIANLD